jgi:hypothetical protein
MATPTYTLIDSVTLGSSAASVTFSSIDQSYGDLILVADVLASGTEASLSIRFNGDSSGVYNKVTMLGEGGAAQSAYNAGDTALIAVFATSTARASMIVQLNDYSATDKHKTALIRFDRANRESGALASRFPSTSAITQIQVLTSSNQYAATSTFYLYGIEK